MAVAGGAEGAAAGVRPVLLAAGAGALLDAILMAGVGPNALLGSGGLWNDVAPALLLAGGVATAAALLPSPAVSLRSMRSVVPHLLPYSSALVNGAVFLLWVFSTVAIYQGCIDVFAGAHAGGAGSGVPDPGRLQLLIVLASVLFTLLPLYLALALRRLIPMGRWADAAEGRDAYNTAVAPPDDATVTAAMRYGMGSPRPRDPRIVIATVTGITAAFVSIGVQLVETGTAPVPPSLWLESQVALPIYSAALAFAVLAVDGSVRSLEERFVRRVRPLPAIPPASPGPGFVQ